MHLGLTFIFEKEMKICPTNTSPLPRIMEAQISGSEIQVKLKCELCKTLLVQKHVGFLFVLHLN